MARRRRRKSRIRNFFLIAAIALIIAGFLTRRLMVPRMLHYLNDRGAEPQANSKTPDAAASQSASNDASTSRPAGDDSSERLTDSDRRALDDLIRQRTEKK